MLTWTCISGKLLYIQYDHMKGPGRSLKNYYVYRSDTNDITYTQDFYALKDRTITLLCNQNPVNDDVLTTALDQVSDGEMDEVSKFFSDNQEANFKIKCTTYTRRNYKFKVLSL